MLNPFRKTTVNLFRKRVKNCQPKSGKDSLGCHGKSQGQVALRGKDYSRSNPEKIDNFLKWLTPLQKTITLN